MQRQLFDKQAHDLEPEIWSLARQNELGELRGMYRAFDYRVRNNFPVLWHKRYCIYHCLFDLSRGFFCVVVNSARAIFPGHRKFNALAAPRLC